MAWVIVCNWCNHRERMVASDAVPAKCSECGTSFAKDKSDDGIVMPFIRSPKTDRTDKVYRDIEKGSEVRAQAAADITGAPLSEMSGLKITDMKDNQREGDIAFKSAPTPDGLGQFFQPNGAEYAAGMAAGHVIDPHTQRITAGIEPRAGMKAMQNVKRIMGNG